MFHMESKMFAALMRDQSGYVMDDPDNTLHTMSAKIQVKIAIHYLYALIDTWEQVSSHLGINNKCSGITDVSLHVRIHTPYGADGYK